jgi:hypothetical protein
MSTASASNSGEPAATDACGGPPINWRRAQQWLALLEREASTAIEHGELPTNTDPKDVAFTINALGVGANCDLELNPNPASSILLLRRSPGYA